MAGEMTYPKYLSMDLPKISLTFAVRFRSRIKLYKVSKGIASTCFLIRRTSSCGNGILLG